MCLLVPLLERMRRTALAVCKLVWFCDFKRHSTEPFMPQTLIPGGMLNSTYSKFL